MKKFRKFNLLFSAVILCSFLFSFSSCSNISSNESESGSVSFALGPEVFKAALSGASKSYTGGILRNEETDWILEELKNISYKMEISINGGYTASAERTWETEDIVKEIDLEKFAASGGQGFDSIFDHIAATLSKDAKFEFTGIPVGKSVYAECKVFEIRTYNGQTEELLSNKQVLLHGRSSEITIKGGENTLPLAIFEAYAEFPFEITLEFDEGTDVASVLSNYPDFKLYPFATDSSFVSSLYSATDDYALYEAAINCYQSEEDIDSLTPISIEQDNYSISGTTLTVTDTTELPVSIANKNKGEEVSIVPIVWFWGTGSLQSKYVGLYTTSEAKPAITPSKSETNKLSIKMKKLDVVDTTTILYSKSGSNYDFKFDNQNYTGSTNSFCFDNDGNFYYLNLIDSNWYIQSSNYKCSSVKATVTYSGEGTVDVTSGMCSSPVIFVDRKTNVLYMAISGGGANTTVIKYPDLISSGATTNSVAYGFSIPDSTYMLNPGQPMTIYNGVVYAVAIRAGYPNKVIKVDLSNTTDVSEIELSSDTDIASMLASASITDLICQDESLYVLISDKNVSCSNNSYAFYSRGALIKYDLITKSIEKYGWTDSSLPIENTYTYVARRTNAEEYPGVLWEDGDGNPVLAKADKIRQLESIDPTGSSSFNIYSPANAENSFYAPSKFIAIKPKKLVIADDGYAFYTDALGAWRVKNVNRVVTVDLDSFIFTCTNVGVNFSGNISTNLTNNNGSYFDYMSVEAKKVYNSQTKGEISGSIYCSGESTGSSISWVGGGSLPAIRLDD